MRRIERLSADHMPDYARIVAYAFPEWGLIPDEPRQKFIKRLLETNEADNNIDMYGLFEDDVMCGGFRVHQMTLNNFGVQTPVTGIGLVAVSMEHKKMAVCRDMLRRYLEISRDLGAVHAMLYPFRPDFYHKMGFGWGARLHVHSLRPQQLPDWPDAERAVVCGEDDLPALRACYAEHAKEQHGMIGLDGWDHDRYFTGRQIVAAVKRGDKIAGFASFTFRETHDPQRPMEKDIIVDRILWRDIPAMRALLHFLRRQLDQCRYIVLGLHDDAFSYLTDDPRHSDDIILNPVFHQNARTGVGWMTRIVNTQKALLMRPWSDAELTVRFEVEDDFLSANVAPVTVRFSGGGATVIDAAPDVSLACRMCDFAPLMVNAVTLTKLHALGLLTLSDDAWLPQLTALFRRDETPCCLAMF